jgi:hypothetical protein
MGFDQQPLDAVPLCVGGNSRFPGPPLRGWVPSGLPMLPFLVGREGFLRGSGIQGIGIGMRQQNPKQTYLPSLEKVPGMAMAMFLGKVKMHDGFHELKPGSIERQRQLPNPPPPLDMNTAIRIGIIYRLGEILRRHVRVEDTKLSDHELVLIVTGRYMAVREEPLLDPNE